MFMCTKLAIVTLVLFIVSTSARPYKDSPIKTIIVPYQANAVGYPYQYKRALKHSRHVHVPETLNFEPNFNLARGVMSMGGNRGVRINFVDGAYPVYYMPGNANGRFNGKIRLLK